MGCCTNRHPCRRVGSCKVVFWSPTRRQRQRTRVSPFPTLQFPAHFCDDFATATPTTKPLFVHTPPIHQRLPCRILPSIQRKADSMSSPARRSTRSSQTPRSTRSSQLRSSPAPTAGPSNPIEDPTATPRQPRQARSSQLASSPLFYGSSSPSNALPNPVSSPLRQMSNTQSTASRPNNAPSSPLRQQTGSQTDGDRTPRASGALIGGKFVVSQLSTVSRAGTDVLQSHLQFATTPAPARDEPSTNSQTYAAKAAPCS